MIISGNDIRVGDVLEKDGKFLVVSKTQHVQPGKGGAYMQVEAKNLIDDAKYNFRFRSDEHVTKAYVDEIVCKFSHEEGNDFVFLKEESFEAINVPQSMIGEFARFLNEDHERNISLKVSVCNDTVVGVVLPNKIMGLIAEADPALKGQTVSGSYKSAKLSNGLKIMVPPHITVGTKVWVNSEDFSYIERVKE